jgi:hypothetical protein
MMASGWGTGTTPTELLVGQNTKALGFNNTGDTFGVYAQNGQAFELSDTP